MSDGVLTCVGVRKRYRGRSVLDGVDVDVQRGEIVALLGPNGAGKTTLMSILAGAASPDSGRVERPAAGVGWVPQSGGAYSRLTVRESLLLLARAGRHTDVEGEVASAATRAGLEGRLDSLVGELSGGMRQRLNISIGTMGSTGVIVLDEPFTGIDLAHRHAGAALLQSRAADGVGILFSTHSPEEAQVADRVLVLVDGRIAYDGSLGGVAAFAVEGADSVGAGEIERGLLALWGEVGA